MWERAAVPDSPRCGRCCGCGSGVGGLNVRARGPGCWGNPRMLWCGARSPLRAELRICTALSPLGADGCAAVSCLGPGFTASQHAPWGTCAQRSVHRGMAWHMMWIRAQYMSSSHVTLGKQHTVTAAAALAATVIHSALPVSFWEQEQAHVDWAC